MLTTTIIATQGAIYIAPAINVHMYAHPTVITNMHLLERWGYHFIEPGAGYLACGYVGKGRLEEPKTIIQAIANHQAESLVLAQKKILISAGPTREEIDPVRFFANRSSGKMGFALAQTAAQMGAQVTLVTGIVHLETTHPNITRIDVTTAEDMYQAMVKAFPDHDVVIKATAVADFRSNQHLNDRMI